MNRRQFLAGIPLAVAAQSRAPSCILVTADQAKRIRDATRAEEKGTIEGFADKALKAGPWSVTSHRPSGFNVDLTPNDYFSEGPYWWPDPKNPNGPYIRKDGERNPERFMGNRTDLGEMCTAAIALGMGAYLLGKTACVDHAGKVLSTWFIDPKTRMNPNLNHGQAVRGRNTGRGTGIIDTVSLIHAVQGIALLELAGGLDKTVSDGTRQWFVDYLKWLTASPNGLDEKKSGNNHATWWTAQVASYASFVNDAALRKMAWEHYRSYLVPTEIRPDGSCPREEARTQSLSYSSMNLDAFSVICRLAEIDGVDLWHFRTEQGAGVETAFNYLLPYAIHPETWRKQQITRYSADSYIFAGLAGVGLRSKRLLAGYRQLPRAKNPWVQWNDLIVRTAES